MKLRRILAPTRAAQPGRLLGQTLWLAGLTILTAPLALAWADTETPPAKDATAATTVAQNQAPAVKPKSIADYTQKGLAYLVSQQDESGGWGQGGGWRTNSQGGGRVEGNEVKDPPDLGNTCIATLALIRAGNTPETGPYAGNVARAVKFICGKVEQSDADSLYVTDVRDTQLQSKIGQFVDTFLAGLVLSELKGSKPTELADKRVLAALNKTVAKIEKNQKEDGTFAGNNGWASVLSLGLCSKALNRAAQNGVAVNESVLARDYEHSKSSLDKKNGAGSLAGKVSPSKAVSGIASTPIASGAVPAATPAAATPGTATPSAVAPAAAEPSDAGVNLYFFAANGGRVSDFDNTNREQEKKARGVLADQAATVAQKTAAKDELVRIKGVKENQEAAAQAIVRQLDDKAFLAGFGNNGGEEFLSYMNISEMLVAKGGDEWRRWDDSVSENLHRVQNGDGSWSGQHCITGRTFCTSAALLTLLADRAPVPLAAKIRNQEKPAAQN